jgi:hypothetical protein
MTALPAVTTAVGLLLAMPGVARTSVEAGQHAGIRMPRGSVPSAEAGTGAGCAA